MRTVGVVKQFYEKKGYGFVAVPGHDDVFVHTRNVKTVIGRSLVSGDRLQFDVDITSRGYQALNVDVVKQFDSSSAIVLKPGGEVVGGHNLDIETEQRDGGGEDGVFVPNKPKSAARVLANYFDPEEIEQITDYLIVGAY